MHVGKHLNSAKENAVICESPSHLFEILIVSVLPRGYHSQQYSVIFPEILLVISVYTIIRVYICAYQSFVYPISIPPSIHLPKQLMLNSHG